jgi:hypothetical protein
MAVEPLSWALVSFSVYNSYTQSLVGDQPVARPLPTHSKTQTEKTHTETSMSWVQLEQTTSVSKREKTFDALDRAAAVDSSIPTYHRRENLKSNT